MKRVLITSNSFGKSSPVYEQKLKDSGFEIIHNPLGRILNADEMSQLVSDVDAIILGSDTVNQAVLEKAKRLKIISRYGVGLDNIDLEVARRLGIKVTVTKGCNTEAVADYTVGLMLSALRHISKVDHHLRNQVWKKETGLDLCHKKVGIIGLGAIGKQVVKRLKGFDCHILAFDQYVDEQFCQENGIWISTIDEICQQTNIISLHVPQIEGNPPLIGSRQLALMNSETLLVNTARAGLVDQAALIETLAHQKIYGYASDVFDNEPNIPQELIYFENVVLSPHNAAVSQEAIHKMSALAVENVLNYFGGE